MKSFVAAGIAASLFIQFPLRCFQVESFVRPFARASEAFHSANVDLVVFDPNMAWQANDLLRNDPFLKERPIIVSTFWLTKNRAEALAKAFPHPWFVTEKDMAGFGLATERHR